MERVTADVLDGVAERLRSGEAVDVHDMISLPLPLRVMGLLFGVPDSDLRFLEGLVRRILSVVDPNATTESMNNADEAVGEFDSYLAALIARSRADPRDDVLSALIADKDGLSDEELRTMIITLWGGGYETTAIGIDNCVLTMLRYPDQAALLRDYDTAFSFVDELLRWESPAQISVKRRYAPEAVDFGGCTLPKGSQVRLLLGAANRDPQAYEDPDRFDPSRSGPPSLAFGGGSHFCGGTLLARTEIVIVMNQLVHRLPGLRLTAEPVRMGSIHLRGFESFLVSHDDLRLE
jgi:cytochrome P450